MNMQIRYFLLLIIEKGLCLSFTMRQGFFNVLLENHNVENSPWERGYGQLEDY